MRLRRSTLTPRDDRTQSLPYRIRELMGVAGKGAGGGGGLPTPHNFSTKLNMPRLVSLDSQHAIYALLR
jgi:hypothetical protein